MTPILYAANETQFNSMGIGALADCISAIVSEERNGAFELGFVYPVDGPLFSSIEKDCIVKVKANDDANMQPQLFRIYYISKPMNGQCAYKAEHVSYELKYNPITSVNVTGTAQDMLNAILQNTVFPHNFTAVSDDSTVASSAMIRVPARSAIGGTEGSLIDIWKGELTFDNWLIRHSLNRGEDTGVIIEYGKNLVDVNQEEAIDETYTSIYPFANVQNAEGNQVTIELPEKHIDSPYVANFAYGRCLPVDLSGDDVTDEASLRTKAQAYVTQNDFGKPKVSLAIDFVQLWQTEEYKNVAPLEHVNLCDYVTVRFLKLGIDVRVKIIDYQYDVRNERYIKQDLGDPKSNLADDINGIQTSLSTVTDTANQAFVKAGQAIINADGTITFYTPTEPTGNNIKQGSIWFKVVNGQYTEMWRYNGISWDRVLSADANDALQAANQAQETADGKNKTWRQAAEPTEGMSVNDQWFSKNADGTETAFKYDGAQWVNPLDDGVKAAQDQAANAVNTAGSALTQAQTAINTANNAASVADNANQSVVTLTQTVYGLSTQVSNKVDTATYNSYTAQTANTIATLLTKTDAAGTYATQTALTATSSSLTSSITAVQTNLNNLQIGGTNLATKSNTVVVGATATSSDGYDFTVSCTTNNQGLRVVAPYESGKLYALSYKVRYISGTMSNFGGNNRQTQQAVYVDGVAVTGSYHNGISVPTDGQFHTVTLILLISTTTGSDWNFLGIEPNRYVTGQAVQFEVKGIKLESGNKATDWSPAPADMATQSQITQLSSDINLRVSKNDVVNQINVSTESILIAGNKVHITGQTTIDNAVIQSAMIAALDAGKITTGTLNAARIGASTITSDKLNVANLAAISANLGNITAGSLNSVSVNAATITGSTFHQIDGTKEAWIDSNGFSAKDNNGFQAWLNGDGLNIMKDGNWMLSARSDGTLAIYGQTFYQNVGSQSVILDSSGITTKNIGGTQEWINADGISILDANNKWRFFAHSDGTLVTYGAAMFGGGQTSWDGTDLPMITLAVGDHDTGLKSISDGIFDLMSNNLMVARVSSSGLTVPLPINISEDNNEAIMTGFNYAGLDMQNNFHIHTAWGLSVSRAGYDGSPAFSVDAINGEIWVRNNIHAGYNLNLGGDAWANHWYTNSLEELKQDIAELSDGQALSLVNTVDIRAYRYKKEVEQGVTKLNYGPIIGSNYNTPQEFLSANGQGTDDHSALYLNMAATQDLFKKYQDAIARIANLEYEVAQLKGAAA